MYIAVSIHFDHYVANARVGNSRSVQLPYGFYSCHVDRMTEAICSEYSKLFFQTQ